MIFLSISKAIQAQRLCGTSIDNLPRTLITTPEIRISCLKAIEIQMRWIAAAKQRPTSINMHESMRQTQIPIALKPTYPLSKFPNEAKSVVKYTNAMSVSSSSASSNIRVVDIFKISPNSVQDILIHDICEAFETSKSKNQWMLRTDIINIILTKYGINTDREVHRYQANMKDLYQYKTKDYTGVETGIMFKKEYDRMYLMMKM